MPKAKAQTETIGGFEFDVGLEIPKTSRDATQSVDKQKIMALPVGASFLHTVAEADEKVKDRDEREKIFKDRASASRNRLSGMIRRMKEIDAKAGLPAKVFAIRIVNDEPLGRGVRVYRLAYEQNAAL